MIAAVFDLLILYETHHLLSLTSLGIAQTLRLGFTDIVRFYYAITRIGSRNWLHPCYRFHPRPARNL